MAEGEQPIVIKKIVKKGGHHGGEWKVAFADFATAMMAFFLLLWLLGFADDIQKGAISEYFQNPAGVQGPGGASTSMIDFGGSQSSAVTPPPQDFANKLGADQQSGLDQGGTAKDQDREKVHTAMSDEEIEEKAKKAENKRLRSLLDQLKTAIAESPNMKRFQDQLLLDITPFGLRIQIIDKANRAMFDLGSARVKPYAARIVREIAKIINQVPNAISISGHTDARKYRRTAYSNWELSSDRANAARRALIQGGLDAKKIGRVVGMGDSAPYDAKNPLAPINRRISIVVMNKQTADDMILESARDAQALKKALQQLNKLTGAQAKPRRQ